MINIHRASSFNERLVAYVLIVGVFLFGLIRTQEIANQEHKQSWNQIYNECVIIDNGRIALRQLISSIPNIEEANTPKVQKQNVLNFVASELKELPLKNCVALSK